MTEPFRPCSQGAAITCRICTSQAVAAGRLSARSRCAGAWGVRAMVERVKGSHLPGATLGLVRRLNMDGEEPELPNGGAMTRRVA